MGGSSSADAAWSMMHVANSDVRNGLSGSGGAQSESTFRSTGGGGEGPAVSRKGKEPASRRYSNDSDIPQAPQRAWAGADRRSSSDSNTIYIPNDSRISQVVVTFRNDTKSSLEQHSPSQMASRIQQQHQQAAAPTSLVGSNKLSHPEANAVYIADHYHNRSHSAEKGSSSNHSSAGGVSSNSSSSKHDFILNFASGESLSDMIFKPPQDTDLAPFIMAPKTMLLPPPPPLHNLESPQSMKRLGLTLGNASSPYRPRRDVSNPARIRATSTKASLTLSSDSSSSEMSSVSSSSESGDMEQEQTEARAAPKGKETGKSSGRAAAVTENNSITDRAIVSVTPLNIISKAVQTVHPDQETLQVFQDTPSAQLTKATHLTTDSEHKQDLSLSALDDEDDPGEQRPQTQPNTCDFFPPLSFPSSASMKSSFEDYTENCLRRTYFDLKSPLANDLSNTQALGDGSFSSSLTSLPEPSSVLALASTSVPSASTLALVSATPPNATTLSAASSSSSSVHTSTSALVSTTINTSKSATMATAASTPAPRLRSSIVSLPLHYWRNRSSSHGADSSVSTTSPFSQNCIASTFSKKKKLIIPTIVIHPDKEDGEPPRVLSQKDIEYLSTTPPPPMQPLVHAWDVITEEDKYEADETMVGQRHDHNSYHPYYQQQQQQQPHQRHPVIYDPILEFDDDYRQQAVKIEGQSGRDHSRQGHDDINDSYALDVPIEAIEVDMDPGESSLNDVKCGRRYL
ncbi:hypothetical protein EDD11_009024 [Mortierella claussenii]|nr:hypothetical protein EDD11_009024 [Mortierella claussenii]